MSTDRIEKLKIKLNKTIQEYGLNSEESRKISIQLDELINKYYKTEKQYPINNILKETYIISLNKIKQITIDFLNFPTIQEWNKFAKENKLLNSQSIQYISGLNWNRLRDKIKLEINKKK